MLHEYKTRANIGIGLGILLIIMATLLGLNAARTSGAAAGGLLGAMLVVRLAAGVLFIWGCCMYAKAKGYSAALGLLGLLVLLGLIVLVLLPDRAKNSPPGFPVVGPGGTRPY